MLGARSREPNGGSVRSTLRLSWRPSTSRLWLLLQLLLMLAISSWLIFLAKTTIYSKDKAITNIRHLFGSKEQNDILADVSLSANAKFFNAAGCNPAILILTYNRVEYLKTILDRLYHLPRRECFTVYISQDGQNEIIRSAIGMYANWTTYMIHPRHAIRESQGPTAYLAQHYRWALNEVFFQRNHTYTIIMEDDLILSEDALILFEQTAPLLDLDPSIWCVSLWNDLGINAFAVDSKALFRTDYFPGLGWMMKKSLWEELSVGFPNDAWDWWMRLDTVSKGRSCIAPRVSRNKNIGAIGSTSNTWFFDKYIAAIKFNEEFVEDFGDLSYLLESEYDGHIARMVQNATAFLEADSSLLLSPSYSSDAGSYIVPYRQEEYSSRFGETLNTYQGARAGYKGVTTLQTESHWIILVDQRTSPFCPEEFHLDRDPSLSIAAASENTDCHETCRALNSTCSRDHFQYINQCSVLQSHFNCKHGCVGGVLGPDVPNFVSNASKTEFYGYCLTNEDWPTCDAKHWSTSRLCPCLPG